MKFRRKRIVFGVLLSVIAYAAVVAGLVAFGTAKPPGEAPAITNPFASIDVRELPGLRRYQARDGAALSYREYDAAGTQMAVLIHGSAGSSVDMHPLALALQHIGISVLVPDIRGHGANLPHGDINYVGQLDDDLADFIAMEKREHPNSEWTLLGFSSGAAFALRISAQSPLGQTMDRYVFVSPYLRYNAPSVRQSAPVGSGKSAADTQPAQSWAAVSLGRIIGLTILNQFGVHIWDDLPVLAFPVPDHIESVTKAYSFRMLKNFAADDDYLADIRRITRPSQVFVGAADELLDAPNLKREFQAQRTDIPVSIVPAMGHSDMVTRPEAIRALVAAFKPSEVRTRQQ